MTKNYTVLIFLLVGCGGTGVRAPSLVATPTTSGSEETVTLAEAPVDPADTMPILMSPPDGGEILLPLPTGGSAPWVGVLMNDQAVAWLEAEPDAVQERAQAYLTLRLGQVRFHLGSEVERLQLRLSTQAEVHQIEIRARDEQIASLGRINDELRSGPIQWWENVLYIGGALVVGIVVGLIGGLLAQ